MKGQIDTSPAQRETVQGILRAHLSASVHVWAFGSRANWTAKDFSDLDLALEGAEPVSTKTLLDLETAFEDSDLPWKVDVIDLNAITPEFRAVVEAGRVRLLVAGGLRLGDHCRKIRGWRDTKWGMKLLSNTENGFKDTLKALARYGYMVPTAQSAGHLIFYTKGQALFWAEKGHIVECNFPPNRSSS